MELTVTNNSSPAPVLALHSPDGGTPILYIAGILNNADLRVEARRGTNGALITSFGSDGGVASNSEGLAARSIAADADSLFIGLSNDTTWRIHKRTRESGALDNAFGVNGILQGDGGLSSLAVGNGPDLYAVGWSHTDAGTEWVVERRNVGDGALEPSFGGGRASYRTATRGLERAHALVELGTGQVLVGGECNTPDGGRACLVEYRADDAGVACAWVIPNSTHLSKITSMADNGNGALIGVEEQFGNWRLSETATECGLNSDTPMNYSGRSERPPSGSVAAVAVGVGTQFIAGRSENHWHIEAFTADGYPAPVFGGRQSYHRVSGTGSAVTSLGVSGRTLYVAGWVETGVARFWRIERLETLP
ncbi:MAG: hypothetical protein HY904_13130 [Deltaproteobacteria bacterium]|nr:hypothetical protein [Deltaproteobacteria bacterium]